jgi:sugar/nucleoside kinase (ribokinase family)
VRAPEPPPASPVGGARIQRLGVLGSFVWDEIHGRDPSAPVIEEWGGITYALGAVDAALPDGWAMVPIAKVGRDVAPQAREFLKSLRRLARDAALVEVEQPNNRVVLRYVDTERRTETLSGGVPPWTWLGLAPLLHDLDALYVNLISGFELDLDTFRLVRQHFKGPIYADLHSLVLAVQPDGARTFRPLPDVAAWLSCCDVVQVNEDELAMLAPDGFALAATAHAAGVRALVVTLGARGVAWFASPDAAAAPLAVTATPRRLSALVSSGPMVSGKLPAEPILDTQVLDPTGCGDVWGATMFSALLGGASLDTAMRAAHRAAARNVRHRGATGLADHLRGVLSLS